jgi:protease I
MASVAVAIDQGFDDAAYTETVKALQARGHRVLIVGRKAGLSVKGKSGKTEVLIQSPFSTGSSGELDALMLLDGAALEGSKKSKRLISLVRAFIDSRKMVFAGRSTLGLLAGAGILRGRKVTGSESLRKAVIDGGGEYINRSFVIDKNLISYRDPGDLPLFLKACLAKLTLGQIRLIL